MAILRVRDDKGNYIPIPAIQGEPGKDYIFTESDKEEIKNAVIDEIPEVPTKTSQLENDSGFITEEAVEPLSDVQYLNGNLFDPDNIVHGEKYNATTGATEISTATVRTKDLIPLDKTKEYNFIFYMSDHSLLPSSGVYGYAFAYDENKNFIKQYSWNTAKPNGKVLKTCHISNAAYLGFHIVQFNNYYPTESPKVMIYEGSEPKDWGTVEYVEYGVGYGKYRLPRLVIDTEKALPHFCNKFLKISYSNFDSFAPINTRETYLTACKLGFDAVKGDVRLTSDNGLIMCHDAGLTYDDNGYLKSYDKNNARVIREMTLDECLNSYHAINNKMLNHLGHRTHMTTFEEYIKICREYDKVAFVTVRDEYIDIIAPLVLNLLEKYNMVENSIINSFTVESLQIFRNLNDRVMLSNVLTSSTILTQAHIDTAIALGNCLVCLFPFPNDDAWDTTMENSKEAMEYAKEKGVLIYGAIANRYADYIKSVHYGLSGLQLSTVVMPYESKRYLFKVTLTEGVATFADEFIAEKYTANVTQTESKISISDIRANGSGSDFDNGLMNLWLNRLPYNLSITEESGKSCDISFSGSSIDINTYGETSAVYHLSVTV